MSLLVLHMQCALNCFLGCICIIWKANRRHQLILRSHCLVVLLNVGISGDLTRPENNKTDFECHLTLSLMTDCTANLVTTTTVNTTSVCLPVFEPPSTSKKAVSQISKS